MLDYATARGGYHWDQVRLFSLGSLPEDLPRGHEAYLAIQDELLAGVRPGRMACEIFARALRSSFPAETLSVWRIPSW
jgi:Xaa-Pro aminopeptidase